MGKATELRRELKRVFLPLAEAHGFSIDQKHAPTFLGFRRKIAGSLHVFDIQWEKYGKPRFVVSFGTCPEHGLVPADRAIPPEQVLASWLPGGQLQPRHGAYSSSWFRQDKPLLLRLISRNKLYPASQIVSQLVQLYPELEAYWATGIVGRHLRITRHTV